MFPQVHEPGRQCQSDFTWMNGLGVTIAGQPFDHMVYHFVLTYSNWEAVTVCFSESFESLSAGLQNALWQLGGVPAEHRSDRMSAAVKNLKQRGEFTERYRGLLDHYGLEATRTQPREPHENGDVEQGHHRFKTAVEQELILRGSRDFTSRESYEEFLAALVLRRNAARRERLGQELERLRRLPGRRLDDERRWRTKVSSHSTIRVHGNTYSVDSRLIGETVEVRLGAERVEVWYGGERAEEMERLAGSKKHRIDYRHVIHSLVRKPGAFVRYRYREDLFPRLLFRVAYDSLREHHPATADRQYLKILEKAALDGEERVHGVLRRVIEAGDPVTFDAVEAGLADGQPVGSPIEVHIDAPEIGIYDGLFEDAAEEEGVWL
jgi:hypothetical protein